MALSAKLQAAVDAARAGVSQANNELEAIAAAYAAQANVSAAAVATALAKAGVDEDTAADLINSARVSVQEHIDSVFQNVGVPQPVPVPPLPVGADPLVFEPLDLASATVGQGYHGQVEVTGGTGPVSFAASPSTAGGILFNSDGTFSGTPTDAGDLSFSITATDSASPPVTADIGVTITVDAAAVVEPDPLVVTTTMPTGTVGRGYTSSLRISGGTAPYSVSSSPASANGIAIDGSGNVSGTPTEADDTSFSITVTDAASPPQELPVSVVVHVSAAAVVEPNENQSQQQDGDAQQQQADEA